MNRVPCVDSPGGGVICGPVCVRAPAVPIIALEMAARIFGIPTFITTVETEKDRFFSAVR